LLLLTIDFDIYIYTTLSRIDIAMIKIVDDVGSITASALYV